MPAAAPNSEDKYADLLPSRLPDLSTAIAMAEPTAFDISNVFASQHGLLRNYAPGVIDWASRAIEKPQEAMATAWNPEESWLKPPKDLVPVNGYSPFVDPKELQDIHGDDILFFAKSQSPEETMRIKRDLRRERQAQELLSRAPLGKGLAVGIATGLVQPENILAALIPVAGPLAAGLDGYELLMGSGAL